MTSDKANRIKYALHSTTWDTKKDSRSDLLANGTKILTTEYSEAMHGFIYCPGCFTGLTRTPKDKLLFTNGRKACFAHLPSNRSVLCDLRSTKPEGKHYETEEDARRAIADEQLVVIHSFMEERPEAPDGVGEYDQTPVEDNAGPLSDVPIGRHRGSTFSLPTRMATVASMCRRFDENLYRYYFFPGSNSALRLDAALLAIETVTEPNDRPALYYGEILRSVNAGLTPKPTNLRMTKLRCSPQVKDFYMKVVDRLQTEKGISDLSVGRYVLFWGRITESGIGLCVEKLKWGEFALLPEKYTPLLTD